MPIHADNLSDSRRHAANYEAKLCLHQAANTTYARCPLHDGVELALGQIRLHIWYTTAITLN